jgi:hypothetical protein
MSACTRSGSVSCLLSRAGEITRWSDDCSKVAATRPDARLASVIFWPTGRDSSRIISCSSAARFTSGATAGVRAKFIRSNVNMPRNSGIETCRGVRGCEASATRTLRLFDAIGFFASCANTSAVTSGLLTNARAASSVRPVAEWSSGFRADGRFCSAFPELSVEWNSAIFTQSHPGVDARAHTYQPVYASTVLNALLARSNAPRAGSISRSSNSTRRCRALSSCAKHFRTSALLAKTPPCVATETDCSWNRRAITIPATPASSQPARVRISAAPESPLSEAASTTGNIAAKSTGGIAFSRTIKSSKLVAPSFSIRSFNRHAGWPRSRARNASRTASAPIH